MDRQPELRRWILPNSEDDAVLIEAQIEAGMAGAGTSKTKGEVGVALARRAFNADLLSQPLQARQEKRGLGPECGPDGNVPRSVHSQAVCRRKWRPGRVVLPNLAPVSEPRPSE
jgi:hypothetical protein